MPGKLVVRADGGTGPGGGHVMRCLALAQEWQRMGGRATFVSRCDTNSLRNRIEAASIEFIPLQNTYPDPMDLELTTATIRRGDLSHPDTATTWAVLDGYHFDPGYQRAVKKTGCKVLVVDDMGHLPQYHADIILNQNINADQLSYSCEPWCTLLLGTKYCLLRTEFIAWRGRHRAIHPEANNILVTLGAADPDNVTQKVINALEAIALPDLEVRVVVGPSNPHLEEIRKEADRSAARIEILRDVRDMPGQMSWADLAVTAGGSTVWELAFMGTPAMVLILAENQRLIAQGLEKAGTAVNLGEYRSLTRQDLEEAFRLLKGDSVMRAQMSSRGKDLVDGLGAERIVSAISSAPG